MPFDKQDSAKSYLIEVAKGNIPGAEIVNISARNAALGTSIEDVWGGGLLCTLDFNTVTTGLTAGLILTGASSGATAKIVIVDGSLLTIRAIEGVFVSEIITDSGSGSASTNGTLVSLGLKVDAVTGEQWELVSESVNDDSSGIGATTIAVVYTDENFVEQIEVVSLSGHTPSVMVSTTALCPRIVACVAYGSATNPISVKSNMGTIVLRETITKNIRAVIAFDDSVLGSEFGLNIAQDSHFVIPAGKVGFITFVTTNVSKNHEADSLIMVSDNTNEGYISGGQFSVYQDTNTSNAFLSPQGIQPETKIKFISKSNNAAVDLNISYGVLLEALANVGI